MLIGVTRTVCKLFFKTRRAEESEKKQENTFDQSMRVERRS